MDQDVKTPSGTEPCLVGVARPEGRTRSNPDPADTPNDWLCAWCLNRVATEKDRLQLGSRSEFSFTNPAGIPFEILTFSRTTGCRPAGRPTMEHTWFAGCAWCYCLCDRCAMHLGWQYEGAANFAGLIRSRIVRAIVVLS